MDGSSKAQCHNDSNELSYEILEILSRQESGDIGETLFSLSENPETCPMMRQSGKSFFSYVLFSWQFYCYLLCELCLDFIVILDCLHSFECHFKLFLMFFFYFTSKSVV